jgi:hypothetical protein
MWLALVLATQTVSLICLIFIFEKWTFSDSSVLVKKKVIGVAFITCWGFIRSMSATCKIIFFDAPHRAIPHISGAVLLIIAYLLSLFLVSPSTQLRASIIGNVIPMVCIASIFYFESVSIKKCKDQK